MQRKLIARKWNTRADLTELMEQARRWIESQPLDQIDLDQVSAEVGLSKYHFLRNFKQMYGTTPSRYAVSAKIERAKALLSEPDSVAAIALQLGFADSTTFGRAFTREVGLSPTAFRNLNRPTEGRPAIK